MMKIDGCRNTAGKHLIQLSNGICGRLPIQCYKNAELSKRSTKYIHFQGLF